MTAPPFILSSKSLVEYSTYWAEHPSIFVAPAREPDPAKRALLVLKWFLSTLKQQYSSRNEKLGSEKKPLNPFLGELFLGRWEDDAGTTQLVSEQVSHHPPVTAYCIWNSKHGVRLQGYNGQKASFSGMTINVRQVGHALLHIDAYDEDYLITLPSMHIEGLISGSPYVELNKSSYIQSSSGYTAKIDYSGKGWLSGKKNTFAAILTRTKEKQVIFRAEGQWNESFTLHDLKSQTCIDSYNAKSSKTTPLTISPIELQDAMESRRAWQKVAHAIEQGDMDKTSVEKSVIENWQRDLRKKERNETTEWGRRFFSMTKNHELLERLAKLIEEPIESERTNGIWQFNAEKAKKEKEHFRDRLEPVNF